MLQLQLKDIIQIHSLNNEKLNNQVFIIDYLDSHKIIIQNIETLEKNSLLILDDNSLQDKSITSIDLLSRDTFSGYAKQNDLLPEQWIDIHFGGDTPFILTGKIVNLEEDSIEIQLFPSNEIIFIDFEYKGLPEDLQIEKINKRNRPIPIETPEEEIAIEQKEAEEVLDEDNISSIKDLNDIILEADQISFGPSLPEIELEYEVDESQKRFSIEVQTNDLLDEILASIPTYKRTIEVMNRIHLLIRRFKQLREAYSEFDSYGNIKKFVSIDLSANPMVSTLTKGNSIGWIKPIVSNQKLIYDTANSAEYDDLNPKTLEGLLDELYETKVNMEQNNISGEINKYSYYLNRINETMEIVTPPLSKDQLYVLPIKNSDTLVDNLENYNSNISSKSFVKVKRFLNQPYQDINAYIKSYLLLPKFYYQYSFIQEPTSSILQKTNINNTLYEIFETLNSNSNVLSEPENISSLFNEIIDLNLDNQPDLDLEKNLQKQLPSVIQIFQQIKSNIQSNDFSVYSIGNLLSPANVYSISLPLYELITQFINEQLISFKSKLEQNRKKFRELLDKPNQKAPVVSMLEIFEKSSDLEKIIYDYLYRVKADFSSSEILKKMYDNDNCSALSSAIALSNLDLYSLLNIQDELVKTNEILIKNLQTKEKTNKCETFTLAKKYLELDELEEDNAKTIYFDKNLDQTNYKILSSYKEQEQSLSPLEFKQFLIKELSVDKSILEAKQEVEALLSKKRKVENGDYAILESQGNRPIYYKRVLETWEEDSEFDGSKTEFCNLQTNCFQIKNNCESIETSKIEFNIDAVKSALKEFDYRFDISKEELTRILQRRLSYFEHFIRKNRILTKNQIYKYNNYQYQLGTYISQDAELNEISPFQNLKNKILGHKDLAQKQYFIVQFANKYTRASINDENPYWRYCIKTSQKLLPTFLFTIAIIFVEKGNYLQTIENIIKTQGKLSDDGDSYVDEHSGYTIIQRDFDVDEGYDSQGFANKSRNILEQEFTLPPNTQEIINPQEETIRAVVKAMSNFLYIPLQPFQEFIIKNTSEVLNKTIPSETLYNRKVEFLAKKNKKIISYQATVQFSTLITTLSFIHFAIQTSIPSVKTNKSFPGKCVKSFDGFPLELTGSNNGIQYISCVAKSLKSSIQPWNSILKIPESTIAEKIKELIEKYILVNPDLQEMLEQKRIFITYHKEEVIPNYRTLSKWIQFLPPIDGVHLKTIEPLSSNFKKSFFENIKKGKEEQKDQFLMVLSKMNYLSLSIIQKIQTIVSKKELLLFNNKNEPFVENYCCNETSTEKTALLYFMNENASIKTTNETIASIELIKNDVLLLSKSIILSSRLNLPSDSQMPESTEFDEKTIYKAFIYYCRFNNDLAISKNIQAICLQKPEQFDKYASISDQIRILKEQGYNFNNTSLQKLLFIINQQNKLNLLPFSNKVSTKVESFQQFLGYLNSTDNSIITDKLQKMLKDLLDTYDISLQEENEEMKELKNYLFEKNNSLKNTITDFIQTNKRNNKLGDKLQELMTWIDIKSNSLNQNNNHNEFRVLTFFHNCIHQLVKVFPYMIKNKVNHQDYLAPKYWGLSDAHKQDMTNFMDSYYEGFSSFYNTSLGILSQEINAKIIDIYILSINIPYLFPLENEKTTFSVFNKNVSIYLYEYCFLSILENYTTIVREIPEIIEIKKDNFMGSLTTSSELENNQERTELEKILVEQLDMEAIIANYLTLIIGKFLNTKNMLNFSYEDLMKRIRKYKEKEKESITEKLEAMEDEERKVNNLLKKHKLGAWGVGIQKGLISYVKETYDQERLLMEENISNEEAIGGTGIDNRIQMDPENTDLLIEQEEYSLNHLPEDDDYGENDGDEGFY